MAKRALLVGCNYPGTKVELHGCANDVKRMHATLTTRFGFDEADILVLLDTDPSRMQPTGENIRSCLAKLVQGTEPGDFLVFHYSGHGTQVPQESGGAVDETGAEEAIVPTDMNLLTDDDFRELVDQIPGGATFTFLSDSCHSGGLIDAEKEQIGDGSSGGGGGLMGLMSQGLGLKTRGFHFPGGGGRRDEEEYGESEEGYERRGRRREGDEEEEVFGRRRREEGGYGGGEAEQFSEETGGRRGRREEEGYGGGHGKSEVDEFAELIGGGRGRREEEGYGRGEAEQFSEEIGGRRGRREEEGYGGGHGKSEVDEFAELIGGGRGRREEGNEGYDRDSEDEQYAGRRRQEEYEGYGRHSEEDQYAAELGGGRRRQEEYEGYGRGGDEEQYAGGRRRKEEYEGYGRGNEEEQYAAELGGGRRRQEEYEGYGRGSDAEQYAGGRQRKEEYEGGSEEEQYAAAGGRRRRGEGRYVGEAEEFAQLIGGDQGVTSKEIPVDMLTEILSERTGHKVDIGNIRTTLFDMFGDQASPTVKMFANLVMQQLQGGDQGGWMGAVSSVATQFLQGKLDGQDADQAASYLAPAQNAGNYRPRPQRRSQRAVDVGVLLSGCQSNETSADANPSNDPADSYGAFSNAIQTVLSETDGALSNRELILRVRKVLQSQGFKQHPCLYCSDENADGPFICN